MCVFYLKIELLHILRHLDNRLRKKVTSHCEQKLQIRNCFKWKKFTVMSVNCDWSMRNGFFISGGAKGCKLPLITMILHSEWGEKITPIPSKAFSLWQRMCTLNTVVIYSTYSQRWARVQVGGGVKFFWSFFPFYKILANFSAIFIISSPQFEIVMGVPPP